MTMKLSYTEVLHRINKLREWLCGKDELIRRHTSHPRTRRQKSLTQ